MNDIKLFISGVKNALHSDIPSPLKRVEGTRYVVAVALCILAVAISLYMKSFYPLFLIAVAFYLFVLGLYLRLDYLNGEIEVRQLSCYSVRKSTVVDNIKRLQMSQSGKSYDVTFQSVEGSGKTPHYHKFTMVEKSQALQFVEGAIYDVYYKKSAPAVLIASNMVETEE